MEAAAAFPSLIGASVLSRFPAPSDEFISLHTPKGRTRRERLGAAVYTVFDLDLGARASGPAPLYVSD
eukprot:1150702-Rhodomonas_salina.1